DLLGRHLAHLQQPGTGAGPAGPTESMPPKRAGPKRPLRAAAAFLVGALVLGGGATAYHFFGQPDETTAPDGENRERKRPEETANHPRKRPEKEPWQPRPPLTPEELAKLSSPFDTLKRKTMDLPDDAPPEWVAVLGDRRRFPLPEGMNSHWMDQTRD